MLKVAWFLLFFLMTEYGLAQVVNIETARLHTDSTGMMGDISTHFNLTRNNQEIISADINSHLQYKTKKDLFLLIGSYGFLKAASTSIIDNTFFHFRYNRKLNKWLRWEAFTQLQKNAINSIELRYLLGTGPRNKIIERKYIKLYIAALLMYEYERETKETGLIHRGLRNSNYVTISLWPMPNVELVTTTFYQPLLKDVKDYRILNQVGLKVKAGRHFGVSINWSYLYDNRPVSGVPRENYTFGSGLNYDF